MASRSLYNKIYIYLFKERISESPARLENRWVSDAQSINVRRKVVDHRLICEHVRKPLNGP